MVVVAVIAALVALGRFDYALLMFGAGCVTIAFSTVHRGMAFWPLAGLAYAALPAASLVWLRSDHALGVVAVLFVFAVAWTTDTGSYIAGRLIGGAKLAPRISPSKTWSGFVIGASIPALVGIAFAAAIEETSALTLALIAVVLALSCQAGDLLESAAKRHFRVKDASQLIPGHGGLLDRIDGLLLAAVVAALIALHDPASPGRGLLIW
jgi:phosphatidate cytidylyltransferase